MRWTKGHNIELRQSCPTADRTDPKAQCGLGYGIRLVVHGAWQGPWGWFEELRNRGVPRVQAEVHHNRDLLPTSGVKKLRINEL